MSWAPLQISDLPRPGEEYRAQSVCDIAQLIGFQHILIKHHGAPGFFNMGNLGPVNNLAA